MEARPTDRLIGRYRVVGVLGAGAMGEVLRARDERLGRDVAIKRVRNALGMQAVSFHARFEAEARALAALAHPGVVQVFDLGVDADDPFLVMELVEGPTLRAVLAERGALSPSEVCALGIQLARALEAAHARGILHRDVKPGNVLRAPGGVWKLADFGVAHVPDSEATISGQFLGTPAYAAPEALTLGLFSPASDVYGLAATLYEAATGSKPRGDATMAELIIHADRPVIDPRAIPESLGVLGPILAAGLALAPAARPTAAGLAELLAGMSSTETGVTATPAAARRGAPTRALATVPAGEPTRALEVVQPGLAPPAAARPRWPLVVGAIVALMLLLAIAGQLGGGSGSGGGRTAGPSTWSTAAGGATGGEPRPAPGEPVTFDAPAELDERSARDWYKVAEKVQGGKLDEALHKLREFERKHGSSSQSARLRAWLEQQAASDEGEGGRGRGRGRGRGGD